MAHRNDGFPCFENRHGQLQFVGAIYVDAETAAASSTGREPNASVGCGEALMKIGNLAERSGVPEKTIRYYERVGLIPSACRAANGYRVYDESDVEVLSFIKRVRGLGFCVADVAALLPCCCGQTDIATDARQEALTYLAEIDRLAEETDQLKQALLDFATRNRSVKRSHVPDRRCGCNTRRRKGARSNADTSSAVFIDQ